MFLADADQVLLPHQRLTAGIDVHVDSQFFALLDDAVDLLKGQVQLVAVLSSPAASAVEVAGRGGVEKNGPGNVAVILFAVLFLLRPADQGGVDKEIDRHRFHDLRVDVVDDMENIRMVRMIGVFNSSPDHLALGFKLPAREFVGPIHDLTEILFRVFINVVKGLFQSKFLDSSRSIHNNFLPTFFNSEMIDC